MAYPAIAASSTERNLLFDEICEVQQLIYGWLPPGALKDMFDCSVLLKDLRASLGPAGRRVEEESLLQAINKVRSLIDACSPPGISKDMFRCNRNLEDLKRMSEDQTHGLHQLHKIDETQQLIAAWFPLEPVKDILTCSFILDNLRVSLAQADRPTEGKESILHALEDAWESIYGWFPPGISKDMLKYNMLLHKSRASWSKQNGVVEIGKRF